MLVHRRVVLSIKACLSLSKFGSSVTVGSKLVFSTRDIFAFEKRYFEKDL